MTDTLTIDGKIINSRLLLGTAGYPNFAILKESVEISGAQIITVAVRRVDVSDQTDGSLVSLFKDKVHFLPNTAGCFSAKEAVLYAKLARESLQTNWVKLEVIGDSYSLYPDSEELLKAAKELIADKFVVFPYCTDDPVLCRKLADLGCAVVMPLASPIGSGQGIKNPNNLELIKRSVSVPVIVDAGIGTASHAAVAMELGMDGILLNTAVAKAQNPVNMARAMKLAIEAGRLAHLAGRIPEKKMATPSTPDRGRINFK